jgi:hypothetical protein
MKMMWFTLVFIVGVVEGASDATIPWHAARKPTVTAQARAAKSLERTLEKTLVSDLGSKA